ncbi:MAG: thiopeptide-type bacteriocin biosynthesis protein, partial [Bacteroidota bacterium]
KERKIPTIIVISEGDNEVVINFDNELSRTVFYSIIKKKKFFEIKEFLFQEASITGNYANEFIASVYKDVLAEKRPSIPIGDFKDKTINQSFSIGDDWLYYKFYCGDKIAEKVLQEAILPIVKDLKSKQSIDQWFFIRYFDKDGFHLRFRMKVKNKEQFSTIINSVKYHIAPLEKEGIIWKTQIDTYLRETERYGYHSIEATEKFFHADSECTLQFVNMIEGEKGEEVRWLFSLLSMGALLDNFGYSLKDKIAIMNLLKTGFGKEFNRKGLLNKQINQLYKQNMANIERFLTADQKQPIYQPLWDILAIRSSKMSPIVDELKSLEKAKKLPIPLALGIIPSYLHMVCNRIFLSKQRVHEMVVYDFLFKYYSKMLHTQKKKVAKK